MNNTCEGCGASVVMGRQECPYCKRAYAVEHTVQSHIRHYDYQGGVIVSDYVCNITGPRAIAELNKKGIIAPKFETVIR